MKFIHTLTHTYTHIYKLLENHSNGIARVCYTTNDIHICHCTHKEHAISYMKHIGLMRNILKRKIPISENKYDVGISGINKLC
jgi:hypothetical protein